MLPARAEHAKTALNLGIGERILAERAQRTGCIEICRQRLVAASDKYLYCIYNILVACIITDAFFYLGEKEGLVKLCSTGDATHVAFDHLANDIYGVRYNGCVPRNRGAVDDEVAIEEANGRTEVRASDLRAGEREEVYIVGIYQTVGSIDQRGLRLCNCVAIYIADYLETIDTSGVKLSSRGARI